ncbi:MULTISPECIES: hypothetical protein [unclassified Caballeronia]|uniref:hypothetical protein n=1 Tax=unclassified Caballeronia TaxID=2646786 RepID=UPI00285917EB|nr:MULTISPECIES: hypothetical protein [unclassified Caballeronia]MDR5750350.1 hypothetical protein [Caballeronia sp. LZ024]MDR5842618.1 hypothetical protein [Caballeronia sp. LZ031]
MSVLEFRRKATTQLHSEVDTLAREESSLDFVPDEWGVDEQGFYVASDADWLCMEAHFARYGHRINKHAPLDSYRNGMRYFGGFLSKIGYLRDHPWHYQLFTKEWTEDEHAYLRAVSNGDIAHVFELLPKTRFLGEIGRKMRLSEGCALTN